jgi:peptide/nickel transport system permease protein
MMFGVAEQEVQRWPRRRLPHYVSARLVEHSCAWCTCRWPLALLFSRKLGLSLLGLATQPPDPSWGTMLNDSRAYLHEAPKASQPIR